MAVVDLRPTGGSYLNADGLLVKLPQGNQFVNRGGVHQSSDGKHMTECFIALASLPTAASGNEQIVLENVVFPNGAFIEKVEVFVTKEPTTSGSPNLDLGLVRVDRSTELDFNGFLAAADAWETGTDLGTTTEYVKGTTEAGALVGTQLTQDGILTASADTADWTAGVVRVRIYWSMVLDADD
jgi:hypothetical protein